LDPSIDKNKFVEINGFLPIDYAIKNKDSLKKNFLKHISKFNKNISNKIKDKKFILFFPNLPCCLKKFKEDNLKESKIIENILRNFSKNNGYYLIIKHKRKLFKPKITKTCAIFGGEYVSYDFYFSDINIVQTCGTPLVESFIFSPKTLQCQLFNHHDYMNIDKYNLLPQADSTKELNIWLNKFNNNDKLFNSLDYKKQVKNFIGFYYGELENVTELIQDKIIQDNYKFKDYDIKKKSYKYTSDNLYYLE
jgi:predicted RND superfamily exporter protein